MRIYITAIVCLIAVSTLAIHSQAPTGLKSNENAAPDFVELTRQLDGRPQPPTLPLPAIRVAILPFRSETGKSNAEWFGNSVPSYLQKTFEASYIFSEIKVPDNDALLESLPKRNLNVMEKLMFSAAYLSADVLIFGNFEDVQGRDAILMTPKLYFTNSRELVVLAPFEVPTSADLVKVAADVTEKVGKILEESAGRKGNPPAGQGKKKISFTLVPKMYWAPTEIFPKLASNDPAATPEKLAQFEQFARSVTRHARLIVKSRYVAANNDRIEGSNFVVRSQLYLPVPGNDTYRVNTEIIGGGKGKSVKFSAASPQLFDAIEQSAREITKHLESLPFPVSGKVYGVKEPGAALRLNERESVPVEGTESNFSFSSRVAPGRGYYIKVNDKHADARDCYIYHGERSAVFNNVDDPYVFCASRTYPIEVKLTGLLYDYINVSLNGKETRALKENGVSAFELYVDDHDTFKIEITRQPDEKGHTCLVKKNEAIKVMGKKPDPVEIKCTMDIQHEIYGSFGMPFFIQPGGETVLKPDGNFPYRQLGLSGTGVIGYRNRYMLPWRMMSGVEMAYTFGRGTANILSSTGKVYFEDERFTYALIEFYAYAGYKFNFNHKVALIPTVGFTYGLHNATYNGQSLYQRQLPGVTTAFYLQYTLSQRWYLESTLRTTYYVTDINFFTLYVGIGGGVRL